MANAQAQIIHQGVVDELKRIRLEKGVSHQKLADLAGVSRPAISFLESGKRNPSLMLCLKICDAMELDFYKILKTVS